MKLNLKRWSDPRTLQEVFEWSTPDVPERVKFGLALDLVKYLRPTELDQIMRREKQRACEILMPNSSPVWWWRV